MVKFCKLSLASDKLALLDEFGMFSSSEVGDYYWTSIVSSFGLSSF